MKARSKRRRQQYVFGAVVAITVLVSLLFLLAFYLPARTRHARLQAEIERLRTETVQRQETLDRLEGLDARLDGAQQERARFLAASLIPREEGFAAMLPDLERMAQTAGIDRGLVEYAVDPEPQFGVYGVNIYIPARGGYAEVSRFIRELENSERFFILDSIGLTRSESGSPDDLDVSLNLTTFFAYEP